MKMYLLITILLSYNNSTQPCLVNRPATLQNIYSKWAQVWLFLVVHVMVQHSVVATKFPHGRRRTTPSVLAGQWLLYVPPVSLKGCTPPPLDCSVGLEIPCLHVVSTCSNRFFLINFFDIRRKFKPDSVVYQR